MDFSSGLFSNSNNKTAQNTSIFTTGKTNLQHLLPVIKGNYGTIFYSSIVNKSNSVNIQSNGDGWTCNSTSG
jgi:Fe-S cluster biogenesis protein NfuA